MARRYVDVIEAEAAIKDLFADMPKIEFMGNRRRWREENEQYLRCLDVLRSLPTADVVERKRGKWVLIGSRLESRPFACSECNYAFQVDTVMGEAAWGFCPNCGAEMERCSVTHENAPQIDFPHRPVKYTAECRKSV